MLGDLRHQLHEMRHALATAGDSVRYIDAAADYGRVIRLKVSELISLLTTR